MFFTAEFGDAFNTLTGGSIHMNPVDIATFYVGKIRALPLDNLDQKTLLDNLVANGGGKGAQFPKVDFNCLEGQYPVTVEDIDAFKRAK